MDKIDPEAIRAKTYHHKTEMGELIEKCLLTDGEIYKLLEHHLYCGQVAAKAQLTKAIPLVAGEIKKEVEELSEVIDWADDENGIKRELKESDWQALFTKFGVPESPTNKDNSQSE